MPFFAQGGVHWCFQGDIRETMFAPANPGKSKGGCVGGRGEAKGGGGGHLEEYWYFFVVIVLFLFCLFEKSVICTQSSFIEKDF